MKRVNLKMAKSFGLLLVTLLLSYSCTDDVEKQNASGMNETDASCELYNFIVNDLGFHPDDVVDYGDQYVAEGDIAFDKKNYVIPEQFRNPRKAEPSDAIGPCINPNSASNGRIQQAVTGYLYRVDPATVRDVQVSIHSSIPQNLRSHITAAIDKWNTVSCTDIRFRLVTGTLRGHVEIRDDGGTLPEGSLSGRRLPDGKLEPNEYARTDFPSESGGTRNSQFLSKPGRTILVNSNLIAFDYERLSDGVRGNLTGLFIHELGHTIGVRHTNWRIGDTGQRGIVEIPLTPTSDASSVFNGGRVAVGDLSSADRTAMQHFYPKTQSGSCRTPLYYYWSPSRLDAFYTIPLTEKGSSTWGYNFYWAECFINTTQVSGTIPLYRYYNETTQDHALKTFDLGAGWRREATYYIYAAPGDGRIPLYEYYSSSNTDHCYTTRTSLSSPGGDSYVFQGIIGFVYTRDN